MRIGLDRSAQFTALSLLQKAPLKDKVLAMQESKRSVIDATLMTDEQIMQKLTWEDVQQLLVL